MVSSMCVAFCNSITTKRMQIKNPNTYVRIIPLLQQVPDSPCRQQTVGFIFPGEISAPQVGFLPRSTERFLELHGQLLCDPAKEVPGTFLRISMFREQKKRNTSQHISAGINLFRYNLSGTAGKRYSMVHWVIHLTSYRDEKERESTCLCSNAWDYSHSS